MMGTVFTKAELTAVIQTSISHYMYQLHFEQDLAKITAELVKDLDENAGNSSLWRIMFAMSIKGLAEKMAEAAMEGQESKHENTNGV